jgi:hypothetical protein
VYLGIMDFTAASHNAFHWTFGKLTVWHNHDVAADFEANAPQVKYMHIEGARVVLRVRGGGEPIFRSGKMWSSQNSFTRSCTTTNASTTVSGTVVSTGFNIVQGLSIEGTGIPAGTWITAVNKIANTFTISQAATTSATNTLTFIPTVFALIGSAAGNFGHFEWRMRNNAANCTMIATNAVATEATFKLTGDIGSAITTTLTRGSYPSGAREVDISWNDYSGGATVTPGWVPQVPGTNNYKIKRSTQPCLESYHIKSTDPTTSDIPTGMWAIYRNTTSGAVKLWANNAGVMVGVALT